MENTTAANTIQVAPATASEIVETFAKKVFADPTAAAKLPAIMLRGAPGIGKSTLVKAVADRLGVRFIDIRLAQMERVDFSGLPSVADGKTKWNIPDIYPAEGEKGIILLDEITSAAADVQVAAYSLVLDRRIPNSGYTLPHGFLVVAAGNRTADKAVVKSMSSALANRFLHLSVEASVEDWTRWATSKGVNPAVVGFINYKPSLLFTMDSQNLEGGFPTPRAWERVSEVETLLAADEDLLRVAVYGLVGSGAGVEYMAFRKTALKFASVPDMLDGNTPIDIPTKSDERFAFTTAVCYHTWRGGDTAKRIEKLFEIIDALSEDFVAMLAKNVMLGGGNISQDKALDYIMDAKGYPKFREKYKALQHRVFNLKK